MPNNGSFDSIKLSTSLVTSGAPAGSPGQLETNIPSGELFRIVSI